MFLSSFLTACGSPILELPAQSACEWFGTLLLNRRAFNYAREQLRPRYDTESLPAQYDASVTTFLLKRQDFIDYFKSCPHPTAAGLSQLLLERLRTRARNWVYNKPTEDLFSQMPESVTPCSLKSPFRACFTAAFVHDGSREGFTREVR